MSETPINNPQYLKHHPDAIQDKELAEKMAQRYDTLETGSVRAGLAAQAVRGEIEFPAASKGELTKDQNARYQGIWEEFRGAEVIAEVQTPLDTEDRSAVVKAKTINNLEYRKDNYRKIADMNYDNFDTIQAHDEEQGKAA